jgi:hypothetical protein
MNLNRPQVLESRRNWPRLASQYEDSIVAPLDNNIVGSTSTNLVEPSNGSMMVDLKLGKFLGSPDIAKYFHRMLLLT